MRTKRGRFAVSELVVGLLLLAAAAVIYLDAQRLPPAPAYGMGPASVPQLIAAGMALLGVVTLAAAFMGGGAAAGEEEEGGALDWGAVVAILASLVVLIALMTLGGGFILGCTVLFAGTAWAFGRRALAADVAIGLVLSALIYAVFTKLLTLTLPEGPLERLLVRGLDAGWASLKGLF